MFTVNCCPRIPVGKSRKVRTFLPIKLFCIHNSSLMKWPDFGEVETLFAVVAIKLCENRPGRLVVEICRPESEMEDQPKFEAWVGDR
jgi:hypothetical protein